MKGVFSILFFAFFISSCSTTFYNIDLVKGLKCDTSKSDGLRLRIKNEGSVGISNIKIHSRNNDIIQFGGAEPHQTTCYYIIPSIYERPEIEVSIINSSFGATSFKQNPIDNIGDSLLTKGNYTFHIKVDRQKNRNRRLKLVAAKISKD
jgi:hypothetical protein